MDKKYYCPYGCSYRARKDDLIRDHIRAVHRDQWISEGFPISSIRTSLDEHTRPVKSMTILPAFPEMTPISGELINNLDSIMHGAADAFANPSSFLTDDDTLGNIKDEAAYPMEMPVSGHHDLLAEAMRLQQMM
jgi:hypothetical protein